MQVYERGREKKERRNYEFERDVVRGNWWSNREMGARERKEICVSKFTLKMLPQFHIIR